MCESVCDCLCVTVRVWVGERECVCRLLEIFCVSESADY